MSAWLQNPHTMWSCTENESVHWTQELLCSVGSCKHHNNCGAFMQFLHMKHNLLRCANEVIKPLWGFHLKESIKIFGRVKELSMAGWNSRASKVLKDLYEPCMTLNWSFQKGVLACVSSSGGLDGDYTSRRWLNQKNISETILWKVYAGEESFTLFPLTK